MKNSYSDGLLSERRLGNQEQRQDQESDEIFYFHRALAWVYAIIMPSDAGKVKITLRGLLLGRRVRRVYREKIPLDRAKGPLAR